VIGAGGVRWAVHVTGMGKIRNAYKIFVGKPEGEDHWETLA
jgi:hypothetical protein